MELKFWGAGFLGKARSIVSSICGLLLQWVSRLPSPMQIPKEFPIYPKADVVGSYMTSSLTSTTPSSCSSMKGNLSGATKNVDYMSPCNKDDDQIKDLMEKPADHDERHEPDHSRKHEKLMNQRCAMTRDYPPPIPPLAYGNLTARMPYALTRHYADGKLTLQVERLKHHAYFEAHRENGRLILNLLTLDGKCCHGVCVEENKEIELEDLRGHVEDKESTEEKMEEDERKEYEETVIDNHGQGRLDGYAIEVVG